MNPARSHSIGRLAITLAIVYLINALTISRLTRKCSRQTT